MPPIDLQSNKQLSETGQPSADRLNWSNRSSDDHTSIAGSSRINIRPADR